MIALLSHFLGAILLKTVPVFDNVVIEAWSFEATNHSVDTFSASSLETCRIDEQITNKMRLFVKLV